MPRSRSLVRMKEDTGAPGRCKKKRAWARMGIFMEVA